MEEQTEEKPKEVGWNLAHYIVEGISQLLFQSAQANAHNNFSDSMSHLKSIRFVISADLTADELKDLDTTEGEFFVSWSKSKPRGFNEVDHVELGKAYMLHKKYSDLLMVVLKKYGYYIPIKKDKSVMGG